MRVTTLTSVTQGWTLTLEMDNYPEENGRRF